MSPSSKCMRPLLYLVESKTFSFRFFRKYTWNGRKPISERALVRKNQPFQHKRDFKIVIAINKHGQISAWKPRNSFNNQKIRRSTKLNKPPSHFELYNVTRLQINATSIIIGLAIQILDPKVRDSVFDLWAMRF